MSKKEFDYKKELLKLESEINKEKHKFNMKELEFKWKIEKEKFEFQKEIQRIRSAEIKKTIDRKSDREFMREYPSQNT